MHTLITVRRGKINTKDDRVRYIIRFRMEFRNFQTHSNTRHNAEMDDENKKTNFFFFFIYSIVSTKRFRFRVTIDDMFFFSPADNIFIEKNKTVPRFLPVLNPVFRLQKMFYGLT